MKRILLALLLFSTPVFAGQSPDVRIGAYDQVVSSRDTAGVANTAFRLSQNTSQPCSMVTLCASQENTGALAWGGSNIHAVNGPGIRIHRGSCDTAYVDDVRDIWVTDTVAGDDINYNYFK